MSLAIAVLCMDHHRQPLLKAMDEAKEDLSGKSNGDVAALVLSLACRNYHICLSLTLCGQLGSISPPVHILTSLTHPL